MSTTNRMEHINNPTGVSRQEGSDATFINEGENIENHQQMGENEGKQEKVSSQKKERCNSIFHIYGEEAQSIVDLVKGRSTLSWERTYTNILKLFKADRAELEYFRAIKEAFGFDSYTESEICQLISEVRADLGLVPYMKRANAQCVSDFQTVFMTEGHKETGKEKVHTVVYCLLQ